MHVFRAWMGGNGTGEDMAEPGMMHDMSTVESICQACMYQQTSTYILCTPLLQTSPCALPPGWMIV